MKNENELTQKDKRELAIAKSVGDQVRKLVHESLREIEEAAAHCDNGESEKPVEAKASFSVKWPAGAAAPNVAVNMSFSVKYKAESDEIVDPSQMDLPITE